MDLEIDKIYFFEFENGDCIALLMINLNYWWIIRNKFKFYNLNTYIITSPNQRDNWYIYIYIEYEGHSTFSKPS